MVASEAPAMEEDQEELAPVETRLVSAANTCTSP